MINFVYIRPYYFYDKQECAERDALSSRRERRKPVVLKDSALPTLAGISCAANNAELLHASLRSALKVTMELVAGIKVPLIFL